MIRRAPRTAALIAVMTLLVGCAPAWTAADPQFATDSGGHAEANPPAPPPPGGPAPIAAPKSDLTWQDCTARLFSSAGVPAAPGVRLDCGSYDADLDPLGGVSGKVSIGAVRARSTRTPADAGPLVFTTGADLPSSLQLPVWLSRAGADVLRTHPIVAIDHRGIGRSSPVDCRQQLDRLQMWDQAQFERGDDPVANLGAVTMKATTDCTDYLENGSSAYDTPHAAEDIEQLRDLWDVPTVALIGVGNGAQVALSYAGKRPDKVSRLILDSPIPLGVAAEAQAEQRVKGQQAALDAFVAQCVAVHCALGGDPKGAVTALLDDARAGHGPGGVSVAALVNAIITALGFPSGDSVTTTNQLADALTAAQSGDINLLNGLINRSQTLADTDGQFIASCDDAYNRPTPDRVRELVVSWGKLYPQFGTVSALDLVKCLNWPSSAAPSPPKELKINVLLLGVRNDPVVGAEGVAATAATIINAGAASKRVMWQGTGHGASIYSSCAVPPLIGYLDSGRLPDTDTYCPA